MKVQIPQNTRSFHPAEIWFGTETVLCSKFLYFALTQILHFARIFTSFRRPSLNRHFTLISLNFLKRRRLISCIFLFLSISDVKEHLASPAIHDYHFTSKRDPKTMTLLYYVIPVFIHKPLILFPKYLLVKMDLSSASSYSNRRIWWATDCD